MAYDVVDFRGFDNIKSELNGYVFYYPSRTEGFVTKTICE